MKQCSFSRNPKHWDYFCDSLLSSSISRKGFYDCRVSAKSLLPGLQTSHFGFTIKKRNVESYYLLQMDINFPTKLFNCSLRYFEENLIAWGMKLCNLILLRTERSTNLETHFKLLPRVSSVEIKLDAAKIFRVNVIESYERYPQTYLIYVVHSYKHHRENNLIQCFVK